MLKFDFLENGLGIASHHIMCMTFQEKCLPCYILIINSNNLIAFSS